MKKTILAILLFFIIFKGYTQCGTICTTPPISNGLVFYYPFCGNANDASGNGRHGTVNGATLTTDRFGNTNSAYSFNGITNNYISLPSIGTHSALTIAGWFLIADSSATPTSRAIFSNKTGAEGGMWIQVLGNSMGFSSHVTGQTVWTTTNTITVDSTNKWHYFAFTFSTTDSARLYIDGNLMASVPAVNKTVISNTPTIGSTDTFTNRWKGKIDDMMLFNRVLSANEIKYLYSLSSPILASQPANKLVQPYSNTYFSVSAIGSSNNYQWQVSTNGGLTFNNITAAGSAPTYSGFTSDTLRLNLIAASNNNLRYRCLVNNLCDTTRSSAVTLLVNCDATNCGLPAVTNGLVAYYPFCGSANDASGNGNNGVVNGATLTTDRFGIANSAYSFNGVNNYIQIPHSSSLSLQNNFTVSLWYKTDDINADQRLIGKASVGTSNSWVIDHRATNQVRLIAASVLSPIPESNPNYTSNNTYVNLTITYNDTIVKFYKDGVLFSTTPLNGSTPTNSNPVRIGVNSLLNGEWFSGSIDDILIYNRALDSAEVKNLYKLDPPVIVSNPTNKFVNTGANTTYKLTATGSNLNFQWQLSSDNGTNWLDITAPGSNPDYNGFNSTTLEVNNVSLAADNNLYRCVITNICDTIFSNSARLDVNCGTTNCTTAAITTGLVAYYPFCGNASDASGKSASGTVVGAVLTTDRFGSPNSAYFFNGTNAHITGSAAGFPVGNAPRTIAAWVKKDSLPSLPFANTIFTYGKDSNGGLFGMENGNASSIYTFGMTQKGALNDFHATHNYSLDQWYHYAVTYNNGRVNLYVDGQLLATRVISPLNTRTNGSFDIGSTFGLRGHFKGSIDDIAVWNRDLTATEIQKLYSGKLQPVINITANKSTICQNDVVTFTATTVHGGITPDYQWMINGSITGPNDSVFTTTSLSPGDTVTCVLNSSEFCAIPNLATSNKLALNINPVPTPNITGLTSVCSNTTTTYTTPMVATSNYRWSITGGTINSGQNTNSVNVTWNGAGIGTLILRDSFTTTGCKTTAAVFVNIDARPTPVISGPNSVCGNSNHTYSTPLDPSNGYNWTITGGVIMGGQGTNSIDVMWNASGFGILTVTDSILNSSCKTKTSNFAVFISSNPNPVITGKENICEGDSVVLTTNIASGVTYQWQLNGMDIIGATNRTYGAKTPGDYSVRVSTTIGCEGFSNIISITQYPTVPLTIVANGPTTICENESVMFSASNIKGTNYQWAFNNVPIPNATDTTYMATAAGYYYINFTNEYGCRNASNTLQVIINPSPTADISALTSPRLCQGNSVYLVTTANSNLTYQWLKNGANITGAKGTYINVSDAADYSVKVTNLLNCSRTSNIITTTVDPKPFTSPITGDSNVTTYFQYAYSVIDNPGSTYNWIFSNGIGFSNTSSINITWEVAGNIQLKVVELNMFNCPGDTVKLNMNINYPVGVNEVANAKKLISIKPNPFTSYIEVNKPFKANEKSKATMYDALGRLVLDQTITENNALINTESIHQAGIYMLHIDGAVFKVIKN